jgi:hypothetical protein
VQKSPEGGAPGGQHPPGRATPTWHGQGGVGPHQAPLAYPFSPRLPFFPKTNPYSFVSHVLAPEPEIFDLFAQSSVSETVFEGWYLVCNSSIGLISFSFSRFYFEFLAILGAAVDELAC